MNRYRRPRTNREEISRCQLIASERFKVSLKAYKTTKALTQLVAVGAGVFAIHQGADPMTVFSLIAFIVTGPEAAEYIWANSAAEDHDGDG
jgi:hypothetical protein